MMKRLLQLQETRGTTGRFAGEPMVSAIGDAKIGLGRSLFLIRWTALVAILVWGVPQVGAQQTPVPPQQPSVPPSKPATDEAESVSAAEFELLLDEQTAAEADAYILRLGSPSYEERTKATNGLIRIGAPAFRKLRTAYHDTTDLEVQLRIESIAHEAFINHHVYDRMGFLGIQADNRRFPGHEDDHRISKDHYGIVLRGVTAGNAAEKVGLKEGDVIVELNGEPFPYPGKKLHFKAFADKLQAYGVGTKVQLKVLRGAETLSFEPVLGRIARKLPPRQGVTNLPEKLAKASRQFYLWWGDHFAGIPASTGAEDR